jgi:hypothetical protein
MKKTLFLLLLPILLGLDSCNRITPEKVEAIVIEGSRDRLPLLLQQLLFIDNITVDSMNLMVKTEPMSGYLYTTWTADNISSPIIVNVTNIKKSKENKGYLEWDADWESAAKAFYLKTMLREDFDPSLLVP